MYIILSTVFACQLSIIGFHNIDGYQNMLRLSYFENESYIDNYLDVGSDGVARPFIEWYMIGSKQQGLSVMILLSNIMILLWNHLKKK